MQVQALIVCNVYVNDVIDQNLPITKCLLVVATSMANINHEHLQLMHSPIFTLLKKYLSFFETSQVGFPSSHLWLGLASGSASEKMGQDLLRLSGSKLTATSMSWVYLRQAPE